MLTGSKNQFGAELLDKALNTCFSNEMMLRTYRGTPCVRAGRDRIDDGRTGTTAVRLSREEISTNPNDFGEWEVFASFIRIY